VLFVCAGLPQGFNVRADHQKLYGIDLTGQRFSAASRREEASDKESLGHLIQRLPFSLHQRWSSEAYGCDDEERRRMQPHIN
jgi:hypothetical protein